MDYKEWIQNKAEEIATEKYGLGFYDLPKETQLAVYCLAIEEHKDHVAGLIDATREVA